MIKDLNTNKLIKGIAKLNRKLINQKNRKLLNNKDFSLISSNCNGALILHDLNLKFLSPTVNLFLFPEHFIKFVDNLKFYLNHEIEFISKQGYNYPIGRISDIEVHFVHYKTNEEAKAQWDKRSKRVNYSNLFIMMTDRDGCNEEIIKRFEELPYKNKVLFTNRKYKYPSTFYVKGFENQACVGNLYEFENIFGKKYYDNFDYIKWFNNGNC